MALRWVAIAGIVELVITMAVVEKAFIPPAAIIAILLLASAIRLRRDGAGQKLATVSFVLFLLVNVVLAAPGLFVPASFGSFAITWLALITSVVGVIAGIASWRGRAGGPAVARVALVATAFGVLAVIVGLVASVGFTDAKPASGDIVITAKGSEFHPATLTAAHGQVSFFLDNQDNTLHNFHIVGAGGSIPNMPANHKVRVTISLNPGTYEYHCDLHDGMKGTITIS
ncbi:MAG TPA: cupredoxin domain-containing protein [Acidimicrobiales bacterium]|jgi:plastocyanin